MENKQRIRTSVPIAGLDTSTPDHSVIDGKCEVLHNLRYTGEAWRNVKQFSESEELPDLEGHTIIYHHPADVDNAYITYDAKTKNGITTYTFYRSEYGYFFNEWSWRHTEGGLLAIEDSDEAGISQIAQIGHFGKMLIIGHNPSKTFHYFFLTTSDAGNPYYEKADIDSTSLNLSLTIPGDQPSNSKIAFLPNFGDGVARCVVGGADNKLAFDYKLRETDFNGQYKYFRGEFLMMAAFVSEEGEIIKMSPMRIFNSALEIEDKFPSQNRQKAYKYHDNTNAFIATTENENQEIDERCAKYPGSFFFCEALGTISIGNISEGARIAHVDIYSTRLYNLIEYESRTSWGDNTTDLFKEPLYRAKRFNIADFKGANTLSFSIDSTFFDNIESGILFTPTQTSADLYGRIALEYNNRLHITDVYTKLNYDSLYDYLERVEGDDVGFNKFLARVSYDGEKAWTRSQLDRLSLSSRYFVCNGNVVEMFASNNKDSAHKKYTMLHSASYNISYIFEYSDIITDEDKHYAVDYKLNIETATAWLAPQKYKMLSEYGDVDSVPSISTSLSEIRTRNAIRASAANVPYSFPYENSYRVGTSTSNIISMNSAAIEMSDSKFGEYPLYVFTNEGVWAIQSGQETLYSAIIPINYDIAINPNTLAVNGAILYFTDKGINALSHDGSKQISSPIHTKENRIPQWMYESKMVYLPEWNEVMCVDFTDRKIYVFSLDNGVWSTRYIPDGYLINNGELISTKIYNLRDEVEGVDSEAVTLLEPQAMAFSIMRSVEDTQYQWSSDWGVLKKSGDEDRSIRLYNYHPETEEVKFTKIYIYRPSQPNFSLTQFNFKATVRAKIDQNFNPKDLIFIIPEIDDIYKTNTPPFGVDGYPEEPNFSTVNVYLPDGRLLTTLENKPNPGNDININTQIFYDTYTPALGIDPDYYGIVFDNETYDSDTELYRIYPFGYFHPYYPDGYIHPDNLVTPPDDVWNDVYKWFNTYYADDDRIFVMTDISFSEDDSSLYYAFDEPLSLDSTADPFVVCVYNNGSGDTAYLCTQTDEDKEENPFDDRITISEIGSGDDTGGGNEGGGDSSHKIELSQASISVPYENTTHSVALTSTCSWQATSSDNWITVNTTMGDMGNSQLSFSVAANSSNSSREGIITITNSDYNITTQLLVVQSAYSQGGGAGGGDNGGDNGGSGGDDNTGDVPIYNPTHIRLKTRPIKLGTGKELKRLETLVLRFEADKEEELKVTIKGSIDGVKFFTLREIKPTTNKDILIRRVPCSVKYLSFEVEGVNITSDIRIIGFDTEYYTRFERRLR